MYSKFKKITDLEWLNILQKSLKSNYINGVKFPGFPCDEIQNLFTGQKENDTLKEAHDFYLACKNSIKKFNENLMDENSTYLDFGSRWGRIVRMFLRDFKLENIKGVDINPQIIELLKKSMTVGEYRICENKGKIPWNLKFDLITSYSVFSYLRENNGFHWIKQIHNVLKSDGLLIITTLSSSFIQICKSAVINPEASDWAKNLSKGVEKSYPNWKFDLDKFPNNKIFYLSTGGGFDWTPENDYGWAVLSKNYIKEKWGNLFEILDFVDDQSKLCKHI